MEPSKKKAKLQHLLTFKASLPGHSQSALAGFVKAAKEQGLPEASSSNDQRKARQQLLESCDGGPLGPLIQQAELPMSDGATVTIHFANLLVFITSLFAMGGSFHDLLQRKHAAKPSSLDQPWSLILYCDEVIPGNVLGRAERKLWAIYATFLQLGQEAMGHEDMWLTISLERSTFVAQLPGGIGQVFAKILEAIFCCPMAEPCGGLLLKSPHGPMGNIRLHFNWGICLADGAAQKQIWSSKGEAGTRFCMLCANIHSAATMAAGQDAIDHATTKYHQLRLTTDTEVIQSYHRLDQRQQTCTKADFQHWQQAAGWTWNAHALLLNQPLLSRGHIRPVSQFCHDWMHGILQGTGPVVLFQTMETIGMAMGFNAWDSMEKYIQLWSCPGASKAGHLKALFSSRMVSKHQASYKFSCQASDLLSIFPIVRHYLHTMVMPVGGCPIKACEAFLAHADLLDQVHQGTMYGATTRASLLPAAELAIQSFVEANFGVSLIKKWHWLLHLPDFLERYGMLPSAFTTERKHKTIAKYATNLQKTTAFESHLMQQVVAMEITTLKEPGLHPDTCQLLKPKKATKQQVQVLRDFVDGPLNEAMVASSAKLAKGGTIHAHDVVVFQQQDGRWEVGQVWFHLEVGAQQVTLLQRWTPTVNKASHSAKCTIANEQGFVPIDSIQYPLLYSKASDQEATVLIPYQLNCRL
ncbi:unnamed protein product [Symbiodinium sp. CCMP2592]|nr:unnamed protein product [Symbiodinium sp. CCMP2592]